MIPLGIVAGQIVPAVGGLGPEMLDNGDFSSTSGWSLSGGSVHEIADGVLKLQAITGRTGSAAVATHAVNTAFVTGSTYRVSFDIVSSASALITVQSADGQNLLTGNAQGNWVANVTYTAPGSSGINVIANGSATLTQIDHVSIKRVL